MAMLITPNYTNYYVKQLVLQSNLYLEFISSVQRQKGLSIYLKTVNQLDPFAYKLMICLFILYAFLLCHDS